MLAFLLSCILLPRISQSPSLRFPMSLWCILILHAVAPDAVSVHVQYCRSKNVYSCKDADCDHDNNGESLFIAGPDFSALASVSLKQR